MTSLNFTYLNVIDKKDFEDCPNADVNAECDYKSWQKSFYIASSTEFIAAAFFLATACFVIKDWDKAIEDEKGKLAIPLKLIYAIYYRQ